MTTAANAADSTSDDVYQRMNELGVATEYQDSLADLIRTGGVPLSNIEGSVPVSVSSYIQSNWSIEKSIFADGSVSVIKSELPQSPLLRGLSGCKVQSGTGFKNYNGCLISNNTITTYFGFKADYVTVLTARDWISSIYDEFVHCYFGSCSDYKFVLSKKYEDASGPATAKLSTIFVSATGLISSTTSIALQVGNDLGKVVVK
ncbi:MAG: hypothetical protein RL140_109 [Actinomycetota bacterium]|jgi:hypothetical protein